MFALLTYTENSLQNNSMAQRDIVLDVFFIVQQYNIRCIFRRKKDLSRHFRLKQKKKKNTCNLGLSILLLWVAPSIHGLEELNSEDDSVSLQNKQKFNILYRKSSETDIWKINHCESVKINTPRPMQRTNLQILKN